MFRAVVFDLFDTLVDLRWEALPRIEHEGIMLPASARALHDVLAERAAVSFADFVDAERSAGERLRRERYDEGRELPTEERFAAVVAHLGIEDPELPAALTRVHMGALYSAVAVPEHHERVLAGLRSRARLALCSNFTHSETAHRVLDEAGFVPHLDPIAVSDAVGWRKPRKEIFEHVLEALDLAPEEVLHVGDNLRADVEGAKAVGLATAWITRRIDAPERRLEEYGGPAPDYVVRDLAEIPDLLSRGGIR